MIMTSLCIKDIKELNLKEGDEVEKSGLLYRVYSRSEKWEKMTPEQAKELFYPNVEDF